MIESKPRRLIEAATISPRDLISVGDTSYRVIGVTFAPVSRRLRVRSTQVGISPQHVIVHYFEPSERVALVEEEGR